ncbi:MFS transporter [Actinopolyspora mortivallis]|uniref:MFS transporter n=1 Tax=Actinopolyspora mortivallis TaxID=33906 RepID=A0A2T0GSN4_ACTMO|nr:MFS transporter [Actinopolyspora mortivallis]PRW62110.1 MFS transporter [Actinopolyspora mortivallis]
MLTRRVPDPGIPFQPSTVLRSPRLRTGLYVLVVLTAGAYLPSPLYPAYQEVFAANDLVTTLVYAAFALVSAPALLLFGSASDVVGPRSVLRISILLAVVGSACFAFASGSAWLIVGRAAQGLALGAVTGAASSLISSGGGERGRDGDGLTSTAFVAGTAVGPIAAGLLGEYAPTPRLLPFLLHLALLWFGWHSVSALPDPGGVRRKRWKPTRVRIPTGMLGVFTTAALTGFLAWTVAGLFLSVIPTLLDRASQSDLAITGGVLGAVLICSVLTQPLVPRLGAQRAQLAGLGALFPSLVLLTLNTGDSITTTLLAAIVAAGACGLRGRGVCPPQPETYPRGFRAHPVRSPKATAHAVETSSAELTVARRFPAWHVLTAWRPSERDRRSATERSPSERGEDTPSGSTGIRGVLPIRITRT